MRAWHSDEQRAGATLSSREPGSALTYLQLIEVAVVASFKRAGLSLPAIRRARAFAAASFGSDHPFAEYRFKSDGKVLLADLDQLEGAAGADKLVNVNRKGQLEWAAVIGSRLQEFDYEGDLAIRWRLAGEGSPVAIDPRVSFGAPAIRGRPTWVFRDRWLAGEPMDETARDFGLKLSDVKAALEFESVDISGQQPNPWLN